VRSTRENRRFSKWKKGMDDFFHGQLGCAFHSSQRSPSSPSPASSTPSGNASPSSRAASAPIWSAGSAADGSDLDDFYQGHSGAVAGTFIAFALGAFQPGHVGKILRSPGESHGQRPRRRPRRGIQRSRRPRHSTSRRSRDSSCGSPLKAQAARVMGHTISMRSATLIAAYGEGSLSPSLPSHSCDRPRDVLSGEFPRGGVSTVSGAGRGVSIPRSYPVSGGESNAI
jgi:hypothetical protein